MNREKEIFDAALCYANNLEDVPIKDDFSKLLATSLGQAFIKGAKWADSHPSLEIVEKIINLAFDGWDSIESFHNLAQSIKKEIENETADSI